jgi:hypothetical protein
MSTFSSAETADEFWKCYQSQIEDLRNQLQNTNQETMSDIEKPKFVSEFKQKLDHLQQCKMLSVLFVSYFILLY